MPKVLIVGGPHDGERVEYNGRVINRIVWPEIMPTIAVAPVPSIELKRVEYVHRLLRCPGLEIDIYADPMMSDVLLLQALVDGYRRPKGGRDGNG